MDATVSFDGLNYIVTTNLRTDRIAMLRLFCQKKVEVQYFRDISRSSKRLFKESA
jgi:hypothetical protein